MKEVASELMPGQVRLNLKTAKAKSILRDTWDGDLRVEFYDKYCNFDNFLKSLTKSHLSYDDMQIFVNHSEGLTIVVRGRHVYTFEGLPHEELDFNYKNIGKTHLLEGVIISDIPENSGYRMMVLVNGDMDGGGFPDTILLDVIGDDHPTISFNCLGQFYGNKDKVATDKIASGKMRLVTFTKDERVPLTDEELKMLGYPTNSEMNKPVAKRKKAKVKSKAKDKVKSKPFVKQEPTPQPGFTRLNREWHRSGTVILHDDADQYIMIGQDESTYFGVQLPCAVDSISLAYEVLIPKEAKGKQFVRQGEWFLVPVDEKEVPKFLECSVMFQSSHSYSNDQIFLPLETQDSNKHYVETDDGRVGKDGKVYVLNCRLSHNDHATVDMKGWCTFYRNTALRSYSQEGVD